MTMPLSAVFIFGSAPAVVDVPETPTVDAGSDTASLGGAAEYSPAENASAAKGGSETGEGCPPSELLYAN